MNLKIKKSVTISLLLYFTYFNSLSAQTVNDYHVSDVLNKLDDHLSFHGYAQGGYVYNDQETPDNAFKTDRIIGILSAKVTNKWNAYFMYSFAGTAHPLELWTEYHLLPGLNIKLGEFKVPYTLENPQSPTVVAFSCFSQAVNYMAGNSGDVKYGSNSGRDQGLQISGDIIPFNGMKLLTYKLAVMNGQGLSAERNSKKDLIGSLTFHPIQGLDLNVSGLTGSCVAAASEYDITGGTDYKRKRFSAGLEYKSEPFEIRSEYLSGKDGNNKNEGYYATAGLHITKQFDVLASYDYFNKNKALSDKQTDYKAGLEYWFYPRCRFQLQYTYQDKKAELKDANVVEALVQVRF
jgi:hypothetical protein